MASNKEDKLNPEDIRAEQEGEELSPEEREELDEPVGEDDDPRESEYHTIQLSGMYENWFLDYASYVILERAVPNILAGPDFRKDHQVGWPEHSISHCREYRPRNRDHHSAYP